MNRTLKKNERLVLFASYHLRGTDGDFIRSVDLYEIIREDEVNQETGLTPEDEKVCRQIAKPMAEKFAQYVRGCREQGLTV